MSARNTIHPRLNSAHSRAIQFPFINAKRCDALDIGFAIAKGAVHHAFPLLSASLAYRFELDPVFDEVLIILVSPESMSAINYKP